MGMKFYAHGLYLVLCSVFVVSLGGLYAADELPLLVKEDFTRGFAAWDVTDMPGR